MSNRIWSAVLVFSLLAFGQEPALTVDQIVRRHVEALGGIDKMRAIHTFSATGNAIANGGQMKAPMLMQMKRPSSMRIEITIQRKKIVQAFDGTTAWTINPLAGPDVPRRAGAEETQEMRDSTDIDFSSLVDYQAKGNIVELVGTEDVDGTPAYKLKVTRQSGRIEYVSLDAKSFLPVKSTTRRKQMGTELDIEAYPADYRRVGGVLFPFSVDQRAAGQSLMQLTIEKVDVNLPLDDARFQMPATQPKADPAIAEIPGTGARK